MGWSTTQRSMLGAFAMVWIAFGVSACKHDLDKLTSKRGQVVDAGTGGRGGSGGKGGTSGKAGSNAGGSSGSAGSEPPDAGLPCEPCEELSEGAKMLDLRSCCRGALNDQCGLTVGEGTVCLPRMVPSQDNAACTDLRILGQNLAGCCRPDGRCGVVAHGTGLGCVAREELAPLASGTPPNSIPCEYSCEADDDCPASFDGLICAETADHARRACAEVCERDSDCGRGSGRLCGLSVDQAKSRVLAICRAPIGDLAPGETCARAEDCLHGVCNAPEDGSPPFCTELCRLDSDCRVGYRDCTPATMQGRDAGPGENFQVCLPPL
jgi:hypothetical protein